MKLGEKRIFRFGVFEADAGSRELRKSGMRLRMQDQPFQVLVLLLERPGELITREEIQQKLWPTGTFVDFDHSLNTSVAKIREVLNDSATNPRFIETLAKRGYRFLAPVIANPEHPTQEPAESPETDSTDKAVSSSISVFTRVEDLPQVSRGTARLLFFLIQAMYLIFYIIALARLVAVQDLLERMFDGHAFATVLVTLTASIGIPLRLYMISAVSFDIKDLDRKFLKLFPAILPLDELWALSPFLLTRQIGIGLALASTAALAYVPFAQRTLVLMQGGDSRRARK